MRHVGLIAVAALRPITSSSALILFDGCSLEGHYRVVLEVHPVFDFRGIVFGGPKLTLLWRI